MPRRKATTKTDQQIAEELTTRSMSAQDSTPTSDTTPDGAGTRAPNIADRFVSMNQLITAERLRTRLNETTIVKTLELAINYHVWQTMRDEQETQKFDPRSIMGESNGEIIGPTAVETTIPDNVVPLRRPGPASGTGEVIYRDDPRHPLFGQPIEPPKEG